jgi:hypothetical protein
MGSLFKKIPPCWHGGDLHTITFRNRMRVLLCIAVIRNIQWHMDWHPMCIANTVTCRCHCIFLITAIQLHVYFISKLIRVEIIGMVVSLLPNQG